MHTLKRIILGLVFMAVLVAIHCWVVAPLAVRWETDVGAVYFLGVLAVVVGFVAFGIGAVIDELLFNYVRWWP
jgi:heme/copper-type cytochrome/quinol oxidase subunit 4